MKHIAVPILALSVISCAPSPAATPAVPSPDVAVMATQIAFNIFATQTAGVPTVTSTPSRVMLQI